MADFNWQNKFLAHLTQINVADTMFFLSLWEINNPYTLLDLDPNVCYAIKLEAFPNYLQRIPSYKECKKGLIFIGYLPAENIESQDFKDRLKRLILKFFHWHPEIIENYNQRHPEERIRMV